MSSTDLLPFRVHFSDGISVDVTAENPRTAGVSAAERRASRGVTITKIKRVSAEGGKPDRASAVVGRPVRSAADPVGDSVRIK